MGLKLDLGWEEKNAFKDAFPLRMNQKDGAEFKAKSFGRRSVISPTLTLNLGETDDSPESFVCSGT